MKKRTKAKKQKLNNLLILLVLTAVLLIMSTYAWFTANRKVNIDAIDVRVATSTGLQISADAVNWGSVLTKGDIADAHIEYPAAANQLPISMAPVSTDLTVENNRLNMFYGIVAADLDNGGKYFLTAEKRASATSITEKDSSTVTTSGEYDKGYYIAFDIFIKSGTPENDFYMSGKVKEVKNTGTTENPKYEVLSTDAERGIANAARIALIRGGNDASTATPETLQALPLNNEVKMWEPNYDFHTEKGIAYGNTYKLIPEGISLTAGVPGQTAVPYSGIKQEFKNEAEKIALEDATAGKKPTYFADVTAEWQTSKSIAEPSLTMPVIDAESGLRLNDGVTKYRVYMWVEGQDIDCENFASGTYLQYDLSFSLDPYDNV